MDVRGWRKVKPHSRHPKKATPESIEASNITGYLGGGLKMEEQM